tara:strand:+ start:1270 stop:2262 length:993 start_codon:yes stop_codon:yes gene_type:complete
MILKPYQLSNISGKNSNFFLFYGQNEGHKNEAIHQILNMGFTKNIFRYEEDEIFKNYNNFISEISNKSFFEEKKIIIISRVSEKIYSLIDDVMNKNIEDAKIILNSKPLDKKSKLRSNFEKEKNLVCIAFYEDNNTTLTNLANKFFLENKVPISREVLNHLIERCRGDRINLKNEISKIEAFLKGKGKISVDEILKLTNLAENYSFSELADACLSKNKKKTLLIINENNFSSEDCVTIIRIFLAKAKRIFVLKTMESENMSIDECLSNYKPPIFWKDKEIVRQQINNWSLEKIYKLIIFINDLELLIKKNSLISVNLLNDFILSQVETNN